MWRCDAQVLLATITELWASLFLPLSLPLSRSGTLFFSLDFLFASFSFRIRIFLVNFCHCGFTYDTHSVFVRLCNSHNGFYDVPAYYENGGFIGIWHRRTTASAPPAPPKTSMADTISLPTGYMPCIHYHRNWRGDKRYRQRSSGKNQIVCFEGRSI